MNNVHKPLAKGGGGPAALGREGRMVRRGWPVGDRAAPVHAGRSAGAHRGSRAAAPGRAVLRGRRGRYWSRPVFAAAELTAPSALDWSISSLEGRKSGPSPEPLMTTIWSAETVGSSTTAPDSSTMTTLPLLKVTSSSWASNFCRPSPSAALQVAQDNGDLVTVHAHDLAVVAATSPWLPVFCGLGAVLLLLLGRVLRAVVVRGAAVVGGAPVQKRRHRQHAGQNHAHHSHLPLVHNRVPSTQVSARRGARGIGFRL